MDPTTSKNPEVIRAPSARVPASAMSLSIVIPVYRSASILPELHRRLSEVLEPLGQPYEIILVEDCGGDGSWDTARDLSQKDHHVRAIRLSRNYGQHSALLCGIRAARYDVVVTIDDDLQNPPEEIPKLLARIAQGNDVVYGTPRREQHGLLRDWASRITKIALQGTMGAETARKVSAFRAFRTQLRHAFESYHSPSVNVDVLLTWATSRFTSETVAHAPRHHGDSGYTLRKLISHALNMMTGFSALPLQMASIVGFSFALFGFGILAYVVGRYLVQGGSVPGFPFLASIIAIFSGAQLFALGIVGEYLSRMHFRSMGRPPYSIRETTGGSDPP
jgi:undecaprenyl-phosphate 4-deoxy-4-formamido-L-arabinose transferase